ncbi:hypothetical protein RRF57_010424 [Xylaria bambusicola]|uniref:Uncharacterized protein n=1 Tax=Xylaria bambusicola TaxID=326684 RepID=A0AAN7UX65_9PEZI
MSQAARADKIYDDLGRIYIYSGASHARTLKELGLEAARKEFRNDLAEWNKTNAATERILRIAYRARITLPPQRELGEAPPRNTNQDDEGDVEGGNKSTVEDGGSEKPLSPPSKIPMKRTFTEEPTSTLDEDGNEVFNHERHPGLEDRVEKEEA